ncbi:MAG: hypothetical protein JXB62_08195 [Pirellulales bacterium]|nr:hypothetical protein [Pirellulales bacterium]
MSQGLLRTIGSSLRSSLKQLGEPDSRDMRRRIGRRPLVCELLEERRLLSMQPPSGPQTVFYDYIEDGVLQGGRLEVDSTDPCFAVVESAVVDSMETAPKWNVTTIIDNGPTGNRIDLVLVGDGYMAGELGTYQTHVNNVLPRFFGESPLDAYATLFNVHRVDVTSNESGVDNDPTEGIERDTALDMRFWCGGTERLLCVNVSKALAAAREAPDVDQVLALANSTKYGGAGYGSSDLATLSGGNSAAVELALHEFGHSFGDLADEYTYGGDTVYTGSEPSRPNVSIYDATAMAARQTKWHLWLDEPNVDTFEGAMYCQSGIYRPTNNSKMRSLGRPFEQVNAEQLVLKIYDTVRPIDDATPPGTYDQTTVFFVDPVDPTTHSLDVQWYVDGSPIPGAGATTLDASTLDLLPGTHTLMAEVVDPTSLVRDEALRALRMTEQRTWTLNRTAGRIQGTLWNDLDGNGVDNAEPGIGGVAVSMYFDDGDATFEPGGNDGLATSQVTAGGGAYAFADLEAGGYWVDVDYGTIPLADFVPTWGRKPSWIELGTGEDCVANFGFREHTGPLTVGTAADEDNGDYTAEDLSLREALLLAAIHSSNDVIRFDAALAGGTIALDPALGQLEIDSDVEIDGPGELTVEFGGNGRVLTVPGGVAATVNGLTICGGGIYNAGEMTVAGCTILGNQTVETRGGGVVNYGAMTIADSTLRGNSTAATGGAVWNAGELTIANSTISGNASNGAGAGVFNDGTLVVTNTTVVGNTGAQGAAGIFNEDGAVRLYNSIVAENFPDNVGGPGGLDSASSHNLVGGDPKLAPLTDNGGLTWTHALLDGSPAIDAGVNDRAVDAGLSCDQRGADRFLDGDANGTATVDLGAFEFLPATVVGRRVFYRDSAFDEAVAPDKHALLPGQTASFANYTSYSRGINGLVVDMDGLPEARALGPDDFSFKTGNTSTPNGWAVAPAPTSITIQPHAGVAGSDRVTIVWPDNAIQNQWLQATVLATADTGLAEHDVFYFGNAVAEAGNTATDAKVNATDMLLARNNPRTFLDPATIDFPYDYNRDARVDATDMLLARNNQTHFLNALRLITVPQGKTASDKAEPGAARRRMAEWVYEFEHAAVKQSPDDRGPAARASAADLLLRVSRP